MSFSALAGTVQVLEPTEGGTTWTITTTGFQGNPSNVFLLTGTAEGITFNYDAGRFPIGTQHLVGVLFEDAQLSLASDIITIDTTQGSSLITVSVTSDTESALAFDPATVTTRLFEDGTYQLLGTVNFDGAPDTIFLQSDIAGLACYGWRRHKHPAA